MSDGIMWYAVGICMGIAIGGSSLQEEVSNGLKDDIKSAARSGAVTTEMNCDALVDLQEVLNTAYNKRASGDDVTASEFVLTVEACEAAVNSKTPDMPRP